MSKNFSAAWLSQSSQPHWRSGFEAARVRSPAVSVLQSKYASHTGGLPSDDTGKDVPNISSSPTSKCSDSKVIYHACGYSETEIRPNRRVRTQFTHHQIARLEKTFQKHKYLGTRQRRKIAEKLHLSETQVKTWFQNRRMKLKREAPDSRVKYYSPALLAPIVFPTLLLQHHTLTGQRLVLPSAASFPHYTPQLKHAVSLHQHPALRDMIQPTLLSKVFKVFQRSGESVTGSWVSKAQ